MASTLKHYVESIIDNTPTRTTPTIKTLARGIKYNDSINPVLLVRRTSAMLTSAESLDGSLAEIEILGVSPAPGLLAIAVRFNTSCNSDRQDTIRWMTPHEQNQWEVVADFHSVPE